jgi:predicted CDP-diglyceride synthetase/phosphatidate cytidylyltransferase
MPKDSRNQSVWLYFAIAILLVIVFAVDCLTPLRVAIWVFYVLPVVLCLWADRPAVPLATAGIATVLMIAGYVLSGTGSLANSEVAQINRAMGIFVLLVLSGVAYLYIKTRLSVQRIA